MSWASLASDQAISYGNLQDAVNNGVFTLVSTIPSPSNRESTKSVVSASVSGFNPNYPPYAVKANNQLVVKRDIYVTGNVTLFPGTAGLVITGITATGGFPSFSYPVDHLVAANYVNSIPAQTITVYINGTRTSTPQSIRLYIDTTIYLCQDITSDGSQSFNFTIPTIYGPSYLYIAIEEAACSITPPPVSFGGGVLQSAISRTSGQYQVVAGGAGAYGYTKGYLYISNDYGATWAQKTPYEYWAALSVSDDGQYMLASTYEKVYISNNYGATWSVTKTWPTSVFYTSSAISNNGTYMYLSNSAVVGYDGGVYVSTNQGSTWNTVSWGLTPSGGRGPNSLTISSSGQYLYAGYNSGILAKSSDYGATQSSTLIDSDYFMNIISLSSSANGSNVIAGGYNNRTYGQLIYLKGTTNGGANWASITSGSTGQKLIWSKVAINNSGTGYSIINSPSTFSNSYDYLQAVTTLSSVSPATTPGYRAWLCVAISGNGTYVLAGHSTGLQRSSNSGSTWTAL
jgi:hypothetical protein